MRPSTAPNIKQKPNSHRSTRLKDSSRAKPIETSQASNRKISIFNKSDGLVGMGKPIDTKLNTLGMLQAYRPGLLKQCMISGKISFDKLSKKGQCNLNDIFIKTALALFRDWREKINNKLIIVIEVVTSSEQLMDPSLQIKIKEIFTELKLYSNKIRGQIEDLSSNKQDFKFIRLREKYVLLDETIEHVIILVDIMRGLNAEVDAYLQLKKESRGRDSEMEVEVGAIAQRYERRATDSLNYCLCHPDNQLLLKLEFKIRKMFIASTFKVKTIFDSIRQLQQYESNFKKRLLFLQNFQDFSHEYLGHVLETLYNKNEQIKLIEKKYQVSKLAQFSSLRHRIEDWQTNFIKKLRIKTVNYFKQALKSLCRIRTLHLVKGRGKEYIDLKKFMVLLVKVYQQSQRQSNITAQYYQFEKKTVKQIINSMKESAAALSPCIETIAQQISSLEGMKEKQTTSALKLLEKLCWVVETLQKVQSEAWAIINANYIKLSRFSSQNPEIVEDGHYVDKKTIQNLHQLILFSRKQQQNNQIFKQLRNSLAKTQDMDAMFIYYDNLYKIHQQFAKTGLQTGLQKARQLKDLLKDELIMHLFGEQFRGEFIGGYAGVKQVCMIEERLMDQAGKQYIGGVPFYRYSTSIVQKLRKTVNDEIKKLDQNKQRIVIIKYIVLTYQCLLIQLLNIKQIYRLFSTNQNHLQPFLVIFNEYVQVYEGLLSKNRRDQTYFGAITSKMHVICSALNQQNRLICQFRNSRSSNQFFPSIQYLTEWIKLQYSAEIEEIINKNAVKIKREEVKGIFDQFSKKMEVLLDKMKNMKSQNKEIYLNINTNISSLRLFDYSENYKQFLMNLMKYLQIINEPHSVIFTQDQSPVYILLSSYDQQQVNDLLLLMLGRGDKGKPQSIITPFDFKNKAVPLVVQEKKDVIQPIANKSQKVQQLIQEIHVKEQIVDQIIYEEHVQIIQYNLPVSSVLKPNDEDAPAKSKQYPKTSALLFNYYKLQQIQSIKQLKSCICYHNNEYSTIQQKLNLALLCQAFKPKGRHTAYSHIQQILDQVAKSNVFRKFNLSESVPECEYQLLHFQQVIRSDGDIRNELLKLLNYFRVERKLIYELNSNFIESFRKYNEESCILNANFIENCYKQDLKTFKIDQIVDSVWKGVNAGMNGGSIPNFITEIQRKIEGSNALLLAYYREIQQKLSNFKETQINRKEIQQQVNTFSQGIFNNYRCIDALKATNMKDLLSWLNILYKNLKEIPVLQQLFSLKIDQNVLFIDSIQITQMIIISCLYLPPNSDDSFSKIMTFGERSTMIQVPTLRTFITSKIKVDPIDFNTVEQFLIDLDRQKLIDEMIKVDNEIKTIVSFGQYAKMFDSDLQAQLVQMNASSIQKKAILSYLLGEDYEKIRKVEQYSVNRQLYIIDGSIQITHLIYYRYQFLDQLAILLENSKVNFHKLKYTNKTIALIQNARLATIAERLSMGKSKIAQLQKQMSSSQNLNTINRLYITFCGVIPTIEQLDEAISKKNEAYLRGCKLQIKQEDKVVTLNQEQLVKKGNLVELQVEWPKRDIQFTLMTPHSTFNTIIPSANYYYFADIQLIALRTHIYADIQKIKQQHFTELNSAEEQALHDEILKQEGLVLLERAQHEKQMQRLRMDEEKACLKLETDELNRKNLQRQAEQAKLRQQHQRLQGQKEKNINNIEIFNNKLKQQPEKTQPVFNINQDVLEFQMCLSQGKEDRFSEERHNKRQDFEYEYRTTVYQHIRQAYHSLRKKPADVDGWLQHQ